MFLGAHHRSSPCCSFALALGECRYKTKCWTMKSTSKRTLTSPSPNLLGLPAIASNVKQTYTTVTLSRLGPAHTEEPGEIVRVIRDQSHLAHRQRPAREVKQDVVDRPALGALSLHSRDKITFIPALGCKKLIIRHETRARHSAYG